MGDAMSTSTPTRPMRRRSWATRIRVGLSLGMAVGLGSVGTMALWSSSAVVDPGSISGSQLDVTVNGQLGGSANRDGALTEVTWGMTDMLPGETRAISFTVANAAGSIPVDIRLNAFTTGTLGPALRFTIFDGGTPTNSGGSLSQPAANTYRTGTCPGGAQTGTANAAVGTGRPAATVVDATKQRLTTGQSLTYCVVVALDNTPATWNNTALQNQSATASFVVRGTQGGAP